MTEGILGGHFSRHLYRRSLNGAVIYHLNIVEGRSGDVDTVGHSVDVQTRTHKAILKPREERLDPHSGSIPRIVEERVMKVTVSVFIDDGARPKGELCLVMTAQPWLISAPR